MFPAFPGSTRPCPFPAITTTPIFRLAPPGIAHLAPQHKKRRSIGGIAVGFAAGTSLAIGAAVGFLASLRFGFFASHYAIILLSIYTRN